MISPDDQLKGILALEWLEAEQRKRVVDRRSDVVYYIAFGAAVYVAMLNGLGVSSFGLWQSGPDRHWGDRSCLFALWLMLDGMLISLMGKFRVIQSQLFLDPKPMNWIPLLIGITGTVMLALTIREWLIRPFSGETLNWQDAWRFGLAFALLAWAYIFRR
ncbi:hypothetical protein GC207_15550 [bacterium]|nr:hypothetical protein [bacterium]